MNVIEGHVLLLLFFRYLANHFGKPGSRMELVC